jgi:drug/metabolite transporter (DMT)-like permease
VALCLRSVGGVRPVELPALLAVGCGDLLANALFAVASSRGEVSVAAVLGSLYPVVTAVLAWAVVKERLRPVQVLGSAMAVAGAVVIAL